MHRDLRYQDQKLTVQTDSYWDGKKRIVEYFSALDLFLARCLSHRPSSLGKPTITYTSRGIADLWSDVGQATPDGLKRLLGDSRARVMSTLQKPQTTIEIAAGLKLSSAAASEQITKLWRAGILERTRIGRRVFYSLNEKVRPYSSISQLNGFSCGARWLERLSW